MRKEPTRRDNVPQIDRIHIDVVLFPVIEGQVNWRDLAHVLGALTCIAFLRHVSDVVHVMRDESLEPFRNTLCHDHFADCSDKSEGSKQITDLASSLI
jgi:hypothetical protein